MYVCEIVQSLWPKWRDQWARELPQDSLDLRQFFIIQHAHAFFHPVVDLASRKPPLAGHLAARKFAAICQPFDLLKVDMQIAGQSRDVKIVFGHG